MNDSMLQKDVFIVLPNLFLALLNYMLKKIKKWNFGMNFTGLYKLFSSVVVYFVKCPLILWKC